MSDNRRFWSKIEGSKIIVEDSAIADGVVWCGVAWWWFVVWCGGWCGGVCWMMCGVVWCGGWCGVAGCSG